MGITAENVRELFTYDEGSGVLFWRNRYNKKPIGRLDNRGYLRFGKNKKHNVHRVIWLYVHGEFPNIIDHIDGDKTNNRIDNLRSVDHTINNRNLPKRQCNTSGVNGVHWNKGRNKWVAQIKYNNKTKTVCYTDDFDQAVAARMAAEKELGHFTERHGR